MTNLTEIPEDIKNALTDESRTMMKLFGLSHGDRIHLLGILMRTFISGQLSGHRLKQEEEV